MSGDVRRRCGGVWRWRPGLATLLLALLALAGPVVALPRVVVQPFALSGGLSGGALFGEGLARLLEDRLRASGRFTLVAREALGELKGEIDRAGDPYFDPSTVAPKGGQLGADLLVKGTVLAYGHDTKDTTLGGLGNLSGDLGQSIGGDLGGRLGGSLGGLQRKKTRAYVRLIVQVIEVRTGRILFSAEREGSQSRTGTTLLGGDLERAIGAYLKLGSGEFSQSMIGRAAIKALEPLAAAMVDLFMREARVLAVAPEGLVLDLGGGGGLKVGQRGRLFSLRQIKNREGRVVWSSRREAGEVEVTEVQPDGALARVLGSAVAAEGDLVVFAP